MSARRPQHEVIVRFARTDGLQDASLASRAQEVLGPTEREALARLRPAAARRDYLAAHALARTMLAELSGCEPARVRLRSSSRGSPEFVPPPGGPRLHFSISHADGVALCAVAEGRAVGADVESLRNVGPDPLGVAEAVCSRRESDALRALPASARAARLLYVWTLKEAVAKATGLGFYFPLADIAIHGEGGGASAVELHAVAAGGASVWRLASSRPTPHHVVAVAVRSVPREQVAIRFEEASLRPRPH